MQLYREAVNKQLAKGFISQVVPTKDQFLSTFFLTEKSNGEKRFILNLKKLNNFIDPPHFKMEDWKTVICTYGTLNTYRSAISLITIKSFGDDPQIEHFCKGASVLKPQKPKFDVIWNETLSLEDLTRKLVTLLALALGQRPAIKIGNITKASDAYLIRISDRLKTSGVGRT